MQTIIILTIIGLVVLFFTSILLFIMLIKACKDIARLEKDVKKAKQQVEYHTEQLKVRAGFKNEIGFDFTTKEQQNER